MCNALWSTFGRPSNWSPAMPNLTMVRQCSYIINSAFGAMPSRTALFEAEDVVSKGLALDEDSVRLHSTLGMLRMFQWRWNESEQAHRRAPNLEPTNSFPIWCAPSFIVSAAVMTKPRRMLPSRSNSFQPAEPGLCVHAERRRQHRQEQQLFPGNILIGGMFFTFR
jgi:hypothetical protein